MDIKIRKATLKDLKIVQELNNGLFKYEEHNDLDSYVKDWALGERSAEYFGDLIENQFVIIAFCDKKPVGYLAGSLYNDDTFSYYEGNTCELENMFVCEDYRKFGIGTKLVNSFFEWCKTQNAKRCFVTATLGNENTIKFYRNKGFVDLNITLKKEF